MPNLRSYVRGEPLAVDLREIDRREVYAMSRREPAEAVRRALDLSDLAWVLVDGDRQLGYGGVAPTSHEGMGCPWLLLNVEPERIGRRWFLEAGRACLAACHQVYPTLANYVHGDNRKSIRWLSSLGFDYLDPVVFNDEPFLPFYRHETPCADPS